MSLRGWYLFAALCMALWAVPGCLRKKATLTEPVPDGCECKSRVEACEQRQALLRELLDEERRRK